MNEQLSRVLSFLDRIGIPYRLQEGCTGFLDKVRIQRGALLVDPTCPVSNVLHEAGHLAILPDQYRSRAGRNVDVVVKRMRLAAAADPAGHWNTRVDLTLSDAEATAWAWAAGLAIGVPIEQIVLDSDHRVRRHYVSDDMAEHCHDAKAQTTCGCRVMYLVAG